MLRFAEHILSVCQENGRTLTNLHLQKIMYFALKFAMEDELYQRDNFEEIYDEPFYVWQYGPVVPVVYNEFKIFGSGDILGEFDRDDEKFGEMNDFINELSEINPFYLVEISHRNPFWKEHKKDILGYRSNVSYELEDI